MSTLLLEDPAVVVAEYLGRVEQLYADVTRWVAERWPAAVFGRSSVSIDQQGTGVFDAPVLTIAGDGLPFPVRLVPRCRYMLGAIGQVDVVNPIDAEALVYVDAGAPHVGHTFEGPDDRYLTGEVSGGTTIPGLPAGWAWVNPSSRMDEPLLVHLDAATLIDRVLETLS